jgi:hypothetical protein
MTNQDLDVTEDEIKRLEEELSKIEGSGISGMSSPTPEKKDSTLVLFRELIKADNSSKFGNLDMTELGKPSVAVRDQLDIANYLDAEGLTKIGDYFRKKAEITFATSLSKKGKLIDNIVTQIKKEQKTSASPEVKKGMFAKWGQHKEGSE